jgi:hypothetical protein
MILTNPAGPAAVGLAVQCPATAIPDIATIPAGRPVVASEGHAGGVAPAQPVGGSAHLSDGAFASAIERAATAVPDLPTVVENADGIVTADGDAGVRAIASIDGRHFGQASIGSQVSCLGGDIPCLAGQVSRLGAQVRGHFGQPDVAAPGGLVRGQRSIGHAVGRGRIPTAKPERTAAAAQADG